MRHFEELQCRCLRNLRHLRENGGFSYGTSVYMIMAAMAADLVSDRVTGDQGKLAVLIRQKT